MGKCKNCEYYNDGYCCNEHLFDLDSHCNFSKDAYDKTVEDYYNENKDKFKNYLCCYNNVGTYSYNTIIVGEDFGCIHFKENFEIDYEKAKNVANSFSRALKELKEKE